MQTVEIHAHRDLGTIEKMTGNGCSIDCDVRPGCENCRGAGTFHCEVLLVSAAPTQSPQEEKQTLHASESWSLRCPSPGLAQGRSARTLQGQLLFLLPPGLRTACHLHKHAINCRINSPRGKLAPIRARSCSHGSGNFFSLRPAHVSFPATAGPRQARGSLSSTGKM